MSAIDYISKNQFVWWQGFVEDNIDPMRVGRVRVRIVGWHNPDKNQLPTQDLPWALPIMPVTSASTTGIGISSTGLVPGSVVIGFFRDGALAQQPIIFGSIQGIPVIGPPGTSYGYGDPRLGVATAGYYLPNENLLGQTGEIGRFAPRSGHYVGETFDPGESLFGGKNVKTVGGIAKYQYDFYGKGITHENSFYGNIYPRFWGGPTGSISPLTDRNVLAGGCGPTHGSKILQEYIIDRASIGTDLPVPKFRPYYEIPLIGYDVSDLLAESGQPTALTPAGMKKLDLGAGGGFRAGDDIFGVYGGLPPLPEGVAPNQLFSGVSGAEAEGAADTASPFVGFETTTSMRGNEFFERIFGATANYIITTLDSKGNPVYSVDKTNPWIFTKPKGTTYTRQYPYNHVYETESGHIMEFDDTNGGERIKIAHRLGTSDEILETGSKVEQVVQDKYTHILGDHNTVVGGNSIFFGERGFKAIINAEALYYPRDPMEGRPPQSTMSKDDDPFVYGPGFLGTGDTGGAGWWNENTVLPDGTTLGKSQFFIDPKREAEVFSGNYQVSFPPGVEIDNGVTFHGGYRGLPRMNFFKGGNTDILVAYGNVNIHVMRGNANLRVDEGDMNVELLKGDMRSYIGGNHFQRIDGSEIRYIAGNKIDVVQGQHKVVAKGDEVTTRGGAGLLNNYVSLDFTLRIPGGDSPIAQGGSDGPVRGGGGGGSDQEFRGSIENERFGGGGVPGGGVIGGL